MKKSRFLLIPVIAILCCGCGTFDAVKDAFGGFGKEKATYTQISQEEAQKIMAEESGYIIVDVRRQDEYDAIHIPDAVLIPNESIGKERPKELPDLDQIILVYCRSGNRSKQASQKLADMGYTNVYEFGGINDWTGEVVIE